MKDVAGDSTDKANFDPRPANARYRRYVPGGAVAGGFSHDTVNSIGKEAIVRACCHRIWLAVRKGGTRSYAE